MIEVNYLAVLLAAVVFMAIGFLWYNPILFGKAWMKEKGLTAAHLKKEQSKMGKYYGMSFLAALVTAFVLSHVMAMSAAYFQLPMLQTGITTAFWMWIGFVAPTQFGATIFGNKNWKLFGIETGYQLVGMLAMSVVIAML